MKRWMLLAALVATAAAHAAPIYRCGKTYSQSPCPGGEIIESSDPRTAAQRAEAKRVVAKEKKLAADLERDRRAREASAGSQATGLDVSVAPPAPAASKALPTLPKKKSTHRKAASSPDFIAVEPAKSKGPAK